MAKKNNSKQNTSSLTITKANKAISKKGLQELMSEVKKKTKKATNVCSAKGSQFNKLEKTIRANWSGNDCDAYLSDLRRACNDLASIVGNIQSTVNKGIDNYQNEFTAFQRNNYKSGTVKIRR